MSLPGAAGRDARVSPPESRSPDQRFPRAWRLTKRRQFLEVYGNGRRSSGPSMAVFGLPNREGHSRLGITVTRKVGGAVARNRLKRVMRDIFRRHREPLSRAPLDLVVNARRSALRRSTSRLEREFLDCVGRLSAARRS